MQSPVRRYQQEMHDNTGYYATWLPSDTIEVGDIGIIDAGRFRRLSSLNELGISFETALNRSQQNVDYRSTDGTRVTTEARAEAVGVGTAEITIEFSREGAFVFQGSDLQVRKIQNPMNIGHQVVKAYTQGRWQKSWLLIESFQQAENATIIVAEEAGAGIVLVAQMNNLVTPVSLVDPKVSLAVKSTRGKSIRLLASKGPHPLYSCLRLAHPLFGSPSVHPVRGGTAETPECPLVRPGVDELLDGTMQEDL